jgi:hypothetical protein
LRPSSNNRGLALMGALTIGLHSTWVNCCSHSC